MSVTSLFNDTLHGMEIGGAIIIVPNQAFKWKHYEAEEPFFAFVGIYDIH